MHFFMAFGAPIKYAAGPRYLHIMQISQIFFANIRNTLLPDVRVTLEREESFTQYTRKNEKEKQKRANWNFLSFSINRCI